MRTVLWRPDLQLDPKDPSDVLKLKIEWADMIGTDPIAGATVTSDAGINAVVDSTTDDVQVLLISAGLDGGFYRVSAIIDTLSGQHFKRSVVVQVKAL